MSEDEDIVLCEICVECCLSDPEPGITLEQDEFGNNLWVCEDHADELASKRED